MAEQTKYLPNEVNRFLLSWAKAVDTQAALDSWTHLLREQDEKIQWQVIAVIAAFAGESDTEKRKTKVRQVVLDGSTAASHELAERVLDLFTADSINDSVSTAGEQP